MASTSPLSPQVALQRLEALCATRECCIGDLQTKMKRWGIDSSAQEEIIASLLEHRFVDEKRFAASFVHDKVRFDRWGSIKIAYALRHKGLSDSIIQAALAEVEETLYAEQLRAILATKRRSMKECESREAQQKLIRFALSRGFDYALIAKELKNSDPWEE